jgi:hypothetical protein
VSTWNPADISGLVLSGGNLTATNNTGSAGGVRGVQSHTRGDGNKYYIEFANISIASGNDGVGFATSSWVLTGTSNTIEIASHVNFGAVRDGGGGSVSYGDGDPSGHVLSVAVDFSNDKYWWRIDANNWNNAGGNDPSANSGGTLITNASGRMLGPWFPAAALVSNGDHVTLRTKTADFTQSVPSGFVPWDNTPSLPVLSRPIVIF